MERHDYPRILRAIDQAIDGLNLEATCYCYTEEQEHAELISYLRRYRYGLNMQRITGKALSWEPNEIGEPCRCPICGYYALKGEYSGKRILSKYCPDCGIPLRRNKP